MAVMGKYFSRAKILGLNFKEAFTLQQFPHKNKIFLMRKGLHKVANFLITAKLWQYSDSFLVVTGTISQIRRPSRDVPPNLRGPGA